MVNKLESFGFEIKDCLIYYENTDFLSGTPSELASSQYVIRRSIISDASEVLAVARSAFTNYVGHFHADSKLAKTCSNEVYADWAHSCVLNGDAGCPTFVAESADGVVGFLSIKMLSNFTADIILNAVDEQARGRGVYTQLLLTALQYALSKSCKRVLISTQVNNFRVQRVWIANGFVPVEHYYTFHLWCS